MFTSPPTDATTKGLQSEEPCLHPEIAQTASEKTLALSEEAPVTLPESRRSSKDKGKAKDDSKPVEKAWMATDKDLVKMPDNNLALVMPSLMLVLFLAALDQTIVATALPTIASKFNATASEYSWVGTSYLLASTIFTTLWGRFSDIVGRKAVLYPGIVVFVVGSALCGASQSMNMLIASRALQGIGGSSIMSLTQFIVGDVVPLEKRGLYNGFLGAVWGIAAAVGPLAGGVLTERASWRWCFFINLPTAGIAFACLFFFLKLNRVQKLTWGQLLKQFDFPGLFLLMIGCALLVVGFAEAADKGWGASATIGLLVVGVVLIVCAGINFLKTQHWTGRTPLIPPRMLKTRTTVFFLFASTFQAIAFLSASYYLPVYFQGVLGANSLMSGVYLIPFSFVVAISTIISGQLNSRLGWVREVAWYGYGLAVLGFGLMIKYLAYGQSTAVGLVLLAVAGHGIGMSLAVPLLVIQAAMPLKDMAASTSGWILTRSMGGTMGIAIFEAVIASQMESRFSVIPGYGTDFTVPRDLTGYNQIHSLPAGSERDAVLTAFSLSLRTLYIIWTPILGTALVLSIFTKKYSLKRAPGGEPQTKEDESKAVDVEKGEVQQEGEGQTPGDDEVAEGEETLKSTTRGD